MYRLAVSDKLETIETNNVAMTNRINLLCMRVMFVLQSVSNCSELPFMSALSSESAGLSAVSVAGLAVGSFSALVLLYALTWFIYAHYLPHVQSPGVGLLQVSYVVILIILHIYYFRLFYYYTAFLQFSLDIALPVTFVCCVVSD